MSSGTQYEELKNRSGTFSQPLSVWVVAFACVISFMGIGLVDPILPAIAAKMEATPSQVSLLFTSYNLVTGIAMLITGFVSSRLGTKWTLITGVFLIIIFSALAGMSHTINAIVWLRGGWGLGTRSSWRPPCPLSSAYRRPGRPERLYSTKPRLVSGLPSGRCWAASSDRYRGAGPSSASAC